MGKGSQKSAGCISDKLQPETATSNTVQPNSPEHTISNEDLGQSSLTAVIGERAFVIPSVAPLIASSVTLTTKFHTHEPKSVQVPLESPPPVATTHNHNNSILIPPKHLNESLHIMAEIRRKLVIVGDGACGKVLCQLRFPSRFG